MTDPVKQVQPTPKVIEQEILTPPGTSQIPSAPKKVILSMTDSTKWDKNTLIMHYYIEYKTNMVSRNHLRNVLALLNTDMTVDEVATFLVKEAARV